MTPEEALSLYNTRMFQYYKSVFKEGFEGGYPHKWGEELVEAIVAHAKKESQYAKAEVHRHAICRVLSS